MSKRPEWFTREVKMFEGHSMTDINDYLEVEGLDANDVINIHREKEDLYRVFYRAPVERD